MKFSIFIINNLPTDNVYLKYENRSGTELYFRIKRNLSKCNPNNYSKKQSFNLSKCNPSANIHKCNMVNKNNPTMYSRPASPQIGQTPNNDPSMMQHINGIQQASMMNNNMDLPSRDIPIYLIFMTQDFHLL